MKSIDNKLKEKILSHVWNQKITCGIAIKIAEEEGVSYREIGMIADELKIKIINCELGCF